VTGERDQRSIAVWDLAPDDGGAPASFQAIAWYATETLIANSPQRYRLAIDGEPDPLERSDGQPIKDRSAGQ
jgi:hypothetical protein